VTVPREDLPTVLVHSRIGSGVTLTLGHVREDRLPDALRGMPWQHVLTRGQRVEVVVRGLRGRGIERKCAAVIARNARSGGRGARQPPLRVWLVAQEQGRVEVAVEAARDLWKRGWRTQPGRAPLRENLAAAVLAAADWQPDEPLVDPMCGSGTLVIEAALRALDRFPGAHRRFAAEFWSDGEKAAIDRERRRTTRPTTPRILGNDRDPRQLAAARANATRARVDRHLRLTEGAFADLEPPDTPGLVVINPPYGDRIAASEKTYHHIRAVLETRWSGFRFAILVPDGRLARFLPGTVDTEIRFSHGGKKVTLARGRVR
jgi:putative N6-adenine-specific DNA methylase